MRSFELSNSNFVSLKNYDILGNEIDNLVSEKQNAASYSVNFVGRNFANGVYFYTLSVGDIKETRKIILVK